MAKNTVTTQELTGLRVVGGKSGSKRIGKVRAVVFHPTGRRVVGFLVKRPDLLWMFRRKDLFVSIEGYDMVDGRIRVRDSSDATDGAACKSLGVKLDDCVLWVGLPLLAEDGTALGAVGNVTFNGLTGSVISIETTAGATANTLLGTREIPAELIQGFRWGKGAAVTRTGHERERLEESDVQRGAVLVSNEAKAIDVEGGLAEKAGAATAVAADKAGKAVKAAGDAVTAGAKKVGDRVEATKDGFTGFKEEFKKESAVAKKAAPAEPVSKQVGKAVNKGARAVGSHLKKSQGMFAAFKEEYDKARRED